jgi:hypothetical protein
VHAMQRYVLCFFAVMVVVAVALFAFGRVSLGVSVLVSPVLIGALAWRWRRTFRRVAPKRTGSGGVFIMATVGAMPGLVLVFVGILIGGGPGYFCVAVGATLIGMAGLLIAMVRGLSKS